MGESELSKGNWLGPSKGVRVFATTGLKGGPGHGGFWLGCCGGEAIFSKSRNFILLTYYSGSVNFINSAAGRASPNCVLVSLITAAKGTFWKNGTVVC